jgi:dihydrolipoamide dehydrogenase
MTPAVKLPFLPEDPRIVDSTGALDLVSIPQRMLVIGGGIVGTHAGDLIGEVCLAVEMGCDPVDVGKTIYLHPTLCESTGMAAELFERVCTALPPARRP